MLKFVGRKFALSLGLMASLGFSTLAAAWNLGTEVVLVVPATVWAGQTIQGYVASGTTPMNVSCTSSAPCPLPPIMTSAPHSDPLYFSIPTWEPMRGSILTVTGGDACGHSKTKPILII